MIKLMSFNIRYGTAKDAENHWKKRKSLVIERIKAFDPDLLGLQECRDDSQAQFIKANLPEYEFLGIPRGGNHGTALEMAPILFKRSVFDLVQQEVFWLSKTPFLPGSKSWDSDFPRTVVWAELNHVVSGRSLIFVNTHFDYMPLAIHESARLLKDWIRKAVENKPLLVTGDFNADKGSSAYDELITGDPLVTDVFRASDNGHEMKGTFHGFGRENNPSPIDWILASSHFEVLKAEVDQFHQGRLYPSDHYPITAALSWKESSQD
jgi:endonuclease/exonuclease/phosphatase family metal-dependent hydrolase